MTCRAPGREDARSGARGMLLPTKALLLDDVRTAGRCMATTGRWTLHTACILAAAAAMALELTKIAPECPRNATESALVPSYP